MAEAYTHARLMEALALFPPLAPDAPPSKELIAELQGPRYELRPRRAKDNDRLSKIPTWVDDEKDSDYEEKKPKKQKK